MASSLREVMVLEKACGGWKFFPSSLHVNVLSVL
jgi:hypothetical protein